MMKRIFGMTLVAALAIAPVALEAQATPGAQQERGVRGGHAFSMIIGQRAALNLTDDQVARLEAIGLRLRAQNAPLLEQMRASGAWQGRPGARGGERPQLTPEQREQMRQRMQNLTPEQREQMRAQRGERGARGARGEAAPEQREQMRQRMQNLTPEQREQMRAQMQQRRGEAGVRGGRQVPEELRPVMEQLRANSLAARQEAQAVLTPEQQTRLRELAQQRRGAGERPNRRPAAR